MCRAALLWSRCRICWFCSLCKTYITEALKMFIAPTSWSQRLSCRYTSQSEFLLFCISFCTLLCGWQNITFAKLLLTACLCIKDLTKSFGIETFWNHWKSIVWTNDGIVKIQACLTAPCLFPCLHPVIWLMHYKVPERQRSFHSVWSDSNAWWQVLTEGISLCCTVT